MADGAVGWLSDRYGRKLPQCIGWMAGIVLGSLLLVVLMVQSNTNNTLWIGYVVANLFLGIQQVNNNDRPIMAGFFFHLFYYSLR